MNMQGRIERVRLKVERAKKHIRDLDAAIDRFRQDQPYTIGTKPHRVPEIKHSTLYIESVKLSGSPKVNTG